MTNRRMARLVLTLTLALSTPLLLVQGIRVAFGVSHECSLWYLVATFSVVATTFVARYFVPSRAILVWMWGYTISTALYTIPYAFACGGTEYPSLLYGLPFVIMCGGLLVGSRLALPVAVADSVLLLIVGLAQDQVGQAIPALMSLAGFFVLAVRLHRVLADHDALRRDHDALRLHVEDDLNVRERLLALRRGDARVGTAGESDPSPRDGRCSP